MRLQIVNVEANKLKFLNPKVPTLSWKHFIYRNKCFHILCESHLISYAGTEWSIDYIFYVNASYSTALIGFSTPG